MRRLFSSRTVILLALTVTVALSFISYQSVIKLTSLAAMVDHTHVVQLNLQRTYSALSDADSELKSFLLTRDSIYHNNLMAEKIVIRQSVMRLKELTSDNPIQNKGITSLDSLIQVWWSYISSSMKADHDDYDFYSAQLEQSSTRLKEAIRRLNDTEESLLQARSDESLRYQSTAALPLLSLQIFIVICLVIGFIGVSNDLKTKERLQRETNQKNAELQEQRDFIQGIFDNTVDVVMIFDPNLNIIGMNKRARKLYDSDNNSIGKNILHVYPQADGSDSIRGIREALDGRHTRYSVQESVIHKGTFYESFFVPLLSGDKIIGAMSIHHDVSDLVKMTSEIKEINRQLKKSNHELEQFAYVTSHDLQEPLRKILMFTDLAKRNIDNQEIVSKNLGKLSASAERMTSLIRDVLNYSRLSNTDPSKELVDLNQVLDQVRQDFELKIEEKEAVVESNRLPIVSGSRQQLTQVFSNIISNALKFCTQPPCIKIRSLHRQGIHTITITDNGIGFEQSYAEQIFGVFQRLHHTSEFAGTGIGLALCKRIIENHGGTITATSAPSKGTTITLTLPEKAAEHGYTGGNKLRPLETTTFGKA